MPVAETCDLVTDGTHFTPKNAGIGVPFLTVKDVSDSELDFVNCSFISDDDYRAAKEGNSAPQTGDVLFSKDGTVGKVHVVTTNRPFAVLSSLAILRPIQGRLDAGYLGHVLRSPQVLEEALRRKTGSAIRRIILADLKRVRIPLPRLPEQERIAKVLDRAEALRAKRRAALAQLDTLAQAIFLDLFGDPAMNPKGWPEKTIAELCEVKGGKRLPKGEEYSQTPTPYRYIRVIDLRDGAVDESTLVYLRPEVQARIARYIVKTDDVIISIAGSIGLTAPVPASLEGANLTENAAKLVPRNRNAYDAGFLATLLRTPFAQDQIGSHIGQVTIGKLALFRVEKLRLPLPPFALQRNFARQVAAIAKLRTAHRVSLAGLDSLFAALQHRAFRGEL